MSFRATRAAGLAFLPLILGAAPATSPDAPPPELHRGIEYPGAAGFFKVGPITVVYPAGAGEPVALNRQSAEARAKWLASVHKCKTVVVSDDQVSEEQRKGNLLLLGWGNRALGRDKTALPFTHGAQGTRFLGITESDPRVDLLLFHRNPANTSSYVLFWSRIDPERDRFQVVPRLGSDWGMYRDYRVVRQGMFVPARTWPPARDTAAEADHTADTFVHPGGAATFDSEHYHVIFGRDEFKDPEIRAIVKAREEAYAKAVAALGPAPQGLRILLHLYDKEDSKLGASSVADPAHEVPSSRELHLVRRVALINSPREEIHILARVLYGPCFLTSVYEGLPLSYETAFQGQDMELHAASLRSAGALPELAVLLDEERFRTYVAQSGPVGAGVFMTWIRQAYGAAGVKKVYGLGEGRTADLAAALGTTEPALIASYNGWADAKVAARKNDLLFMAAEDEAQSKRLSSDWAGMSAALRKALVARPGDLQTLFNLASAQMRANDLSGAESSLKTMLAGPIAPADSRFRVFGHYQLGRVFDLAGRRADALKEYDATLALPDDHGVHALAQERKRSPATREQLE